MIRQKIQTLHDRAAKAEHEHRDRAEVLARLYECNNNLVEVERVRAEAALSAVKYWKAVLSWPESRIKDAVSRQLFPNHLMILSKASPNLYWKE